MSYGQNHAAEVIDAFTSSITANWTQSESFFDDFAWSAANGGVIVPAGAGFSFPGMRYTASDPSSGQQYCTITLQQLDSTNIAAPRVRVQPGGGGYDLFLCGGGSADRYRLSVRTDSNVETSLGYTPTGVPVFPGWTVTVEAEGTTIRGGTNEGSGDTLRHQNSDNTFANGSYGVAAFGETINTAITAVEAGQIDSVGEWLTRHRRRGRR